MKTRNVSLPLVILATLMIGSSVHAQQVEHFQLFGYIEKIPAAPAFPDNSALISEAPTRFEDNSDLNAFEKRLEDLGKEFSQNGLEQSSSPVQIISDNAPPTAQSLPPSIKPMLDSIQSALKDLESVKTDFTSNFQNLENVYHQRVNKADQAAGELEVSQPCNGNAECQSEHLHMRNNALVAASREKIINEEYLLSVYINKIKPSFKQLDNLLQSVNLNDPALTPKAKFLFRGAQQDQIQLLTDILERLKLERITISNCARMAQQGLK